METMTLSQISTQNVARLSQTISFNQSAVISPIPFVCKDLNPMGKIKATITSLFKRKPHPMMKSNPIPNLYAKISTQREN
jgi:hypothetical protein